MILIVRMSRDVVTFLSVVGPNKWVGRYQEKLDKKVVSRLELSIDGCRIWALAVKIRQKSLNVVSSLNIGGCMHPLS